MGIVVIGAVFVDIKGYPLSTYIPGGRNSGRAKESVIVWSFLQKTLSN